MTRIAIVSDIHGNLPALLAVVAHAEASGVSHFLNLGDSLSGPLWPAETADFLIAKGWLSLAGNHERQLLTLTVDKMNLSDRFAAAQLNDNHRLWLSNCPAALMLDSEGVFLCHGTPVSDVAYWLHSVDGDGVRQSSDAEILERACGLTAPFAFAGHTHLQRIWHHPDGQIIANPGSVGLPAYEDDHPHHHLVEAGTPEARYAIFDGGAVTLQKVIYDFECSARKAEAEGRHDWAIALRTGKMR